MKWFLAKLIFRIVCGQGNHTAQFEEQLRLINAEDELHAFHKARLLGEADCKQDISSNSAGVKWIFIDISELHALSCASEGVEIFSMIKEEADPNLYIRSIQKMASHLLQQGLHQFTGINCKSFGT